VKSLTDIDCHEDILETEKTLQGNALIKARYVKENYGFDCFADDTGLEIDALNGEPGVYSARYAGENCTFEDNVDLVLSKLENESNRSARFRTVIALLQGEDEILLEGSVNGQIIKTKTGGDGFGYDPIFKPEGFEKTFAQMTIAEKNEISHRGKAVKKLIKALQEKFDLSDC
jgi:XTP/dITP diphosphohydrolase